MSDQPEYDWTALHDTAVAAVPAGRPNEPPPLVVPAYWDGYRMVPERVIERDPDALGPDETRPIIDRALDAPYPFMDEPTPIRDALVTITAPELAAESDPDVADLVERLYPRGGVCLQAGDPKSFKTMLAIQAAVSIASPDVDELLGRRILRHGPVLFVEEEGARRKIRERVGMMCAGLGIAVPDALTFALHQGVRLDEDASLDALRATVAVLGPVLVVLDPLVMLHSGDENKASEMGRVMRGLIGIAAEHDCLVLVVHHVNKPQAERRTTRAAQRLRGSSAFAGATDATLIMDRDGDRTAKIRCEYRDGEPHEMYVALDVTTLLLHPELPPEATGKAPPSDVVLFVKERGTVGVAEVMARFGVTKNTARASLERAVATGHLGFNPDGAKHLWYPVNPSIDLALTPDRSTGQSLSKDRGLTDRLPRPAAA